MVLYGRVERLLEWAGAHPARAVIWALVAVLVITTVGTSFHTVETDQQAVILRFGRLSGIREPGLHWKLPLGIDQAFAVAVGRVHKLEFGFRTSGVSAKTGRSEFQEVAQEVQLLTGDENIADVEWIVQYKIRDPKDYLFSVANPEGTIEDVSRATMALVVGDCSVTEVLTERRAEIAFEVKAKLQAVLDGYHAGVEVQTVALQNVRPPTQVSDSFNDVNRARQDMETTINQANKELLKTLPLAEGEAGQLKQAAEGYALKRVNRAHGDAARFRGLSAEYKRAKGVTRERLYLEALADLLPKLRSIWIVDEKQGATLKLLDLKGALTDAVPAGATGVIGTETPREEHRP